MMMEKLWMALICWQRSVPSFSSFPVHHIIIIIIITTTMIIIIMIIIIVITIIIEICKAPTLRLKALTKHSVMHIMYTEMENVIRKREKTHTHNVDINMGSA